MSYLYFGVNVQGSASTVDESVNIFPGICTSAVAATTNGATDYIVDPVNHAAWGFNVWTGAANTRSCVNSIVFLGVEDGLWSSTGWYWEDVTMVTRRTFTTAVDGTPSYADSTGFLFAQDAADVEPGESDLTNETTELESSSYEGRLKAAGYRSVDGAGLNSAAYWYRSISDSSEVLRDACLPALSQDQYALNCGACDYFYRGGTPADFGTFATTAAYAVGEYVKYGGKLYMCVEAHAAGAWNDDHFELCVSRTITRRSYWLVSLGYNRHSGA